MSALSFYTYIYMTIGKILHNGHFLSPEGEVGNVVIVDQGGMILSVGSNQIKGDGAEVVDMRGQWILPTFEDAHNHLAARARTIFEIDLRNTDTSWQDARERIAERARNTEVGQWVACHGWNEAKWGLLGQHDLDEISQEHGIFLINISYHGGLVNTKGAEMLSAAGFPCGKHGKITEDQFEAVTIATLPDVDGYVAAIPKLQEKLLSLGIGALHDMHVLTVEQLKAFRALEAKDALLFPVILYINPRLLTEPYVQTYLKECSDAAKLVGLKLFLDGAIGVSTAAINGEYFDGSGSGKLRYTDDECVAYIQAAAALGLSQVAMHCIGDRAIEQACRLFKNLKEKYPQITTWRFEHFEMPSADAIDTLAKYGGIASVQPNFSWDVDNYAPRLGDKKTMVNPLRTMLDSRIMVAFGSDVAPSGPLIGIRWATTKAPHKDERVTLSEALRAYTETPARVAGFDDVRGKIAPGYQANFTVLTANPLNETSWQSDDGIKIAEVWIKGKKMFSA